jgi:hypothetical protein
MGRDSTGSEPTLCRCTFLATTGGVLAGTAALGLVGQAEAGKWHPQRGGILRKGLGPRGRGKRYARPLHGGDGQFD